MGKLHRKKKKTNSKGHKGHTTKHKATAPAAHDAKASTGAGRARPGAIEHSQAGSGHSAPDWPTISNVINDNLQALLKIYDYAAYLRLHGSNPDLMYVLQGKGGAAVEMAVKKSILSSRIMTEKKFYDKRWPKAKGCREKNVKYLSEALQLLAKTTTPLQYIYCPEHNSIIRCDTLLFRHLIDLQKQLMRFPTRQAENNLEKLFYWCGQIIQSKPDITKPILNQFQNAVAEGQPLLERQKEKQGNSHSKLMTATLSKLIIQQYIVNLYWGSDVKFHDKASEISFAIDLAWLLACRLGLRQELFGHSFVIAKGDLGIAEYINQYTTDTYAYLSQLNETELATKLIELIQELSRSLAAIPDQKSLLDTEIGTLMKLIYSFPCVVGVTPHEHLSYDAAPPGVVEWLKQAPARTTVYITKHYSYAGMIRQEQNKYIEQCQAIERRKAAEQQRLKQYIDSLETPSSIEEEKPESTTASSKGEKIKLFPYLPDFEKQCCIIHIDLTNLTKDVKTIIVQAIRETKPPCFVNVNRLLVEFLETIRAIPDRDANHRAQKAMFAAGCYLQFLRAHLPFLNVIETHLEEVNTYSTRALAEIQTLKEHTDSMSSEYSSMLGNVISEIGNCEQAYLNTIQKNHARNKRIKALAAQRRKERGDHSAPKSRDKWYPGSRTDQTVKKLGLAPTTKKGTPQLFKTPTNPRHQRKCISAQVDDANRMLGKVAATPAHPHPTLAPTTWLQQSEVIHGEGPTVIVYDNPDFLTIMQALKILNPEIARRTRLHGGAIRDFLITPDKAPNDWDFEFFGDFTLLASLLPPGYSLDRPILITDGIGRPIFTTKLPLNIDGKEVELDITIKDYPPTNQLDNELRKPSNADFNPNGSYTYCQKDGQHIIFNYEGSSEPEAVMRTAQAPLSTISHATLRQDPLLILRALKLLGQYDHPASEALTAELQTLNRPTFSLSDYSENVQAHFRAYLNKHRDHILSATILKALPRIKDVLDESLYSCSSTDTAPRKSIGI
ncbi:MAG: hypothetical protein P1U40_00125 [Coxiellaceae bacterium]|nr:hypothetical protein [Coxiellaceae bacterium]